MTRRRVGPQYLLRVRRLDGAGEIRQTVYVAWESTADRLASRWRRYGWTATVERSVDPVEFGPVTGRTQ
jgi:hypothetical protein